MLLLQTIAGDAMKLDIGARIKELREARGLSTNKLSNMAVQQHKNQIARCFHLPLRHKL